MCSSIRVGLCEPTNRNSPEAATSQETFIIVSGKVPAATFDIEYFFLGNCTTASLRGTGLCVHFQSPADRHLWEAGVVCGHLIDFRYDLTLHEISVPVSGPDAARVADRGLLEGVPINFASESLMALFAAA
jgi:hypothetical protein